VRYSCDFEHRDTGARKTIVAALSAEQIKSVEAICHRGSGRCAGDGLCAQQGLSRGAEGISAQQAA